MIKREKIIKRIGTSIGLILNKEEASILGIEKGDLVQIQINKIKKEESE